VLRVESVTKFKVSKAISKKKKKKVKGGYSTQMACTIASYWV